MGVVTETGSLAIGYKGKLFQQPKCDYQFAADIPKSTSPEADKAVEAAFKKLWAAEFKKLREKKAKEIRVAMEGTEKDISKKTMTEDALKKFIETANKLIEQGIDNWRKVEVPRLVEAVSEKCYAFATKLLKREIAKQAFKCAVKITVLVLIVLAVAAATIAVSVATMGVGTGAILLVVGGALLTGGGAVYKIYDTVQKEAIGLDKTLKDIQSELDKIDKAYAYQKKKEDKVLKGGKLGPKEKVKIFFGAVSPHIKALKSKMSEAEMFVHRVRSDTKKSLDKLVEAEEALRKAESEKVDKATEKLFEEARTARYNAGRTMEKLHEKLGRFSDLQSKVEKQIAEFETKGEWAGSGAASSVAKTLQENAPLAKEVVTNLATLVKHGKKLAA